MGLFQDIGKTVSNIGKGVVDVVKATHAQPIADAYQSITGKKVNINYNTATGRTVATGMSVVGNTSSAIAKGFVNQVSAGTATKATNSIRAVENRDGDGTSLFGPTTGGFAQLQAEADEKAMLQAAQMAQNVGIKNMPKSALPYVAAAAKQSWFQTDFWQFIFA